MPGVAGSPGATGSRYRIVGIVVDSATVSRLLGKDSNVLGIFQIY